MRANLQRGKLIPPPSLDAAQLRRKQLEHEIKRVEGQISDPARIERFGTDRDAYMRWRTGAERAFSLFVTEYKQLCEWITSRTSGAEALLREAYEVLKVLEEETDSFDPHEYELLNKLHAFFGNKEVPARQFEERRVGNATPQHSQKNN